VAFWDNIPAVETIIGFDLHVPSKEFGRSENLAIRGKVKRHKTQPTRGPWGKNQAGFSSLGESVFSDTGLLGKLTSTARSDT
jgi:hypothetical protein